MSNTYEVINGVTYHFGRRTVDGKHPQTVPSSGNERELIVPLNYGNPLDGTTSSKQPMNQFIPAYAQIVEARIFIETAYLTGTALEIGTYNAAGTAIDANGLFTTTELAVANLTANTWIVGAAGAQLGASVGAADAYLGVVESGSAFTAGQGKLIVTYRFSDLPDKA